MEAIQPGKNILKALFDFQNEDLSIAKDTQGYGYKYAPLDKIMDIVKPNLKAHGLLISQPIQGKSLITKIYHVDSGESIESSIDINELENVSKDGKQKMNNIQALGAAITYLRRYSVVSILMLVTDEDTDGRTPRDEPKNTPKNGSLEPLEQTKLPEKPWLGEEQLNSMIEAIKDGRSSIVSEKMKNYKIRTSYKTELDNAFKDAEKIQPKETTPMSPTLMGLLKKIDDATTLERLEDIKKYNPELMNNTFVITALNIRLVALKKGGTK